VARFDRQAATAKRLIDRNGRAVELVKRNTDPGDPARPWAGNAGSVDELQGGARLPATVAFVPVGGSGLGHLFPKRAGDSVGQQRLVGLVASSSFPDGTKLEEFDVLVDDDGRVWGIQTTEELNPAAPSILYALALTR
jgi:hypothetical protein